MEAADDICYAIVDLEDAAEIGILDPREFERLLAPLVEEERFWGMTDPRQKCAALRGTVVGKCVTEVADRFMAHQDALLSGAFVGKDLISVCGADVREVLTAAKALASEKIYRHRTKLVTEIAAYPCLATLLNALVPAVHGALVQGESALTPRLAAQLSLLDRPLSAHDTLYTAYMQVLDFVGSMTDNAAAALAREISGVGIV
jgi:dGTPase